MRIFSSIQLQRFTGLMLGVLLPLLLFLVNFQPIVQPMVSWNS